MIPEKAHPRPTLACPGHSGQTFLVLLLSAFTKGAMQVQRAEACGSISRCLTL
jgi:hypothetical protein